MAASEATTETRPQLKSYFVGCMLAPRSQPVSLRSVSKNAALLAARSENKSVFALSARLNNKACRLQQPLNRSAVSLSDRVDPDRDRCMAVQDRRNAKQRQILWCRTSKLKITLAAFDQFGNVSPGAAVDAAPPSATITWPVL
jgi:hypothetical protein